jgi:acyl-CoA dehydrogenase
VLIAAEAIGVGRHAVDRAARYARERIVFGRPIGQNQAIQHPLARCWMNLEAAWLATLRAGWAYDTGRSCGAEANTAKYLAGEAAFEACERAVMTLGGMGYAREYHVERLLREVFIPRIAPVSPELVLCYIAERVLGLPRSY